MEGKSAETPHLTQVISANQINPGMEDVSWTRDEDTLVKRKVDLLLLPMLISGFFVLQLDRSNISNALSNTITTDLKITSDQVNTGSQLMFAGIVIAEVPSNLLLQKIGASKWLMIQMFIWGVIALTQSWCTNIHSFYATRFLLGLFEAGYIPGAQYMLASFYVGRELSLRTSIFYFGNYLATACGSLIAAGVLQMAEIHGLSGWQWLFIIEGSLTLAVFLLLVCFLPQSPQHTAPIHGLWDMFSERQRTILTSRVVIDDDSKSSERAKITPSEFKDAILCISSWLHMLLNIVSLAPKGGIQLYGPTIFKHLGFSQTMANLLNSVGSFLTIILLLFLSFASDKTRLRGPWCIVAFFWSLAFAAALFALRLNSHKWLKYAMFTLLTGGNALSQSINDAWLNINAKTASRRSIGLAMAVMGANIGDLVGQQFFRSGDGPEYTVAFTLILVFYALAICVALILIWVYWRANESINKHEEGSDTFVAQRRLDL